VPRSLDGDKLSNHNPLQKHQAALQRVTNNANAIYGLLDAAGGPVKVTTIQTSLNINAQEYRKARQHLTANLADDVYITQDGLVLRKHVKGPHAASQRFWHLAWSLGLFEVSGQQLIMDEDMLGAAPAAFVHLLNTGKLPADEKRLTALQVKARQRIGTLLKVVNMYRSIDRALGLALIPYVQTKDWKAGLKEISDQLKKLSP
jgi:hypothetical protein